MLREHCRVTHVPATHLSIILSHAMSYSGDRLNTNLNIVEAEDSLPLHIQ